MQMTHLNGTTNHVKGKHLTEFERHQIQILKSENYSNRAIAKILNRAPQTINNEINRGTVKQIKRVVSNGKEYFYDYECYFPDVAQLKYETNRMNSCRTPKHQLSHAFIDWADKMMLNKNWSPDVVVAYAKKNNIFCDSIIPCVSTLYNWIERGIMKTSNIDLIEKISRKPNTNRRPSRKNKKVLGKSIEDRSHEINSRDVFGHWEIDTVIGSKLKNEKALLTLVERQTRFEIIVPIKSKTNDAVTLALSQLKDQIGNSFSRIFKSITSDNGSEFCDLTETLPDTEIYFTHPYSSWERGTKENHHKFIRRIIPKGISMGSVSDEIIYRIQNWMNNYPRKILDYETPKYLFLKSLKSEGLLSEPLSYYLY